MGYLIQLQFRRKFLCRGERKVEILFLFSVVAFFAYRNWQYKKSAYYQITKNSYFSTRFDKGKYGEYLTYKALRYFERNGGKFLCNN